MNRNTSISQWAVQHKLAELYEELLAHDGFGEFRVEFRLLRRGQKEVIIHCGKQYRYVVDFRNAGATARAEGPDPGPATAGGSAEGVTPSGEPL